MLERDLRTAGCPIDVINAGIPGYNTEQEVSFLKELIPRFRPDIVVVGSVMNDAEPQFTVAASPDVLYCHSGWWIVERSKMALNEAFPSTRELRSLRADLHVPGAYLEGFAPESPKRRESRESLRRIAEICFPCFETAILAPFGFQATGTRTLPPTK